MMESLQQTAQAAIWMDADVTELMSEYRRVRREWAKKGVRLSLTAPILKALAWALKEHPDCRTCIGPDGSLLVLQKIDIAVAVQTPAGLLVPVLRNVDKKNIQQVAVELTELTERARMGSLSSEEMSGHTMTVSNLGMFGVTYMKAVLNTPESMLLGVGAADLRPVYRNGGLFPREILPLSLTFDHRIIDGSPAADFLRDVCRALSPALFEEA
jgi:pyruvate dehydrogenase E2 component (dihydrolipoamide acetyltransferase)